jgi:transposase
VVIQMSKKRPEDTPIRAEMERRRLIAERLLRAGASQTEVARHLKVSQASVSRWSRNVLERKRKRAPKPTGAELVLAVFESSHENPAQGPPPFLTLDQLHEVWKIRRTKWTGREFGAVIFEVFGVRYSLSHSCELLSRLKKAAALAKGGRA